MAIGYIPVVNVANHRDANVTGKLVYLIVEMCVLLQPVVCKSVCFGLV